MYIVFLRILPLKHKLIVCLCELARMNRNRVDFGTILEHTKRLIPIDIII